MQQSHMTSYGGLGGMGGVGMMGSMGEQVQMPPFDHEAALVEYFRQEVNQVRRMPIGAESEYKQHNDLPLARIKRIMKSDEDVRMISAEAPVLFAKACELFIAEITMR